MTRFLVLADDRTGALETAGGLTAWWGPATVVARPTEPAPAAGPIVVDLGSRHLEPARAASAVRAALARHSPDRVLLKMDSTLRGNWASDAVEMQSVTGRPAVVVPAFPAAGRTCHRGVVMVDGRPVAEGPAGGDPRSPLRTSRPAELLRAAGARAVTEVSGPRALGRWLADRPSGFVVGDAVDDRALDLLGTRWAEATGTDFVGTAASIAAAVGAGRPPHATAPRPAITLPALVVVGSLHPMARAQVERLAAEGWIVEVVDPAAEGDPDSIVPRIEGDRLVLVSPEPAERGPGSAEPAQTLARVARRMLAARPWAVLVIVGGDTAAAVLGDGPVRVEGLLAPGIPWARAGAGPGPLLITKPGGFGGPGTIVELFGGRVGPA